METEYSQGVPLRFLVTRFTNAISCFEPCPQEPYRDLFETPCRILFETSTATTGCNYVYSCQRFSSGNTLEDYNP
jgi:hypothetical protein